MAARAMRERTDDVHTAVRHYCLDRYEEATAGFATHRSAGTQDSAEAQRQVARYVYLYILRVEVERLDAYPTPGQQDGLAAYLDCAQAARQRLRSEIEGDADFAEAVPAEESAFVAFLASLDPAHPPECEVLPYSRTLSDGEVDQVREVLQRSFNFGEMGYPLDGRPPSGPYLVFRAAVLNEHLDLVAYRNQLVEALGPRVLCIREGGIRPPSQEVDTLHVPLDYSWAEVTVVPVDVSSVWYASHESTVLIAGEGMLRPLRTLWPSAPRHQLEI